ncbi:MAG TPA: HAMP domain-containing sensor histidine kinase [Bryobacteraceae bacterium]|nr:HAMP domain-containing sensor histidine kinase [Bryobacteraceae bacterium]
MSPERNLRLNSWSPAKPPNVVLRAFGGLKVRQKLAILHNIFFFVLAVSVYVSLIPLFASHLEAAKEREFRMVAQVFASELPQAGNGSLGDLSAYGFREGSASQVGLPQEGQEFLKEHSRSSWQGFDNLYRNAKRPGIYRRVTLPTEFYDTALRRARFSLFAALGTIYILSIVVLEFIIMPQYVYQPLTLMLNADSATQRDDREKEMIDQRFILNDEIGQIMKSRNATVAQLRRHEDDLAGALQKLEEQDRLVSLGLLSTSVAHELNTPLAVLQGSIEKLQETTKDSQTLERLARMLRVTQRLRKISEGLVDFARVRKQETEAVALRPIIDESWNLVAIDEKAAAVSFSNQVRDGEIVLGNADRLVQVFVNLLRNALLAVSAGGEIRIESKHLQRGGNDWVCCTVLDDGPGIPPNILPNLFEAFVTTRLDARGTGLGLTVAEGIVTQHGGTISASNRPSGGACLEVTLPAA